MASVSDIINAVDRGDTELVESMARELDDQSVDLSRAYDRANMKNRAKKTRGQWQDIVDILHSYVYEA